MNNIINFAMCDLIKEWLKQEVEKGEPKEKIRLIDFDPNNSDHVEIINNLKILGYIEDSEQENIKLISQGYYEYLKALPTMKELKIGLYNPAFGIAQ